MTSFFNYLISQIDSILGSLPTPSLLSYPFHVFVVLSLIAGVILSKSFFRKFSSKLTIALTFILFISAVATETINYRYLRDYSHRSSCNEADYATHVSLLPMTCQKKLCYLLGPHAESYTFDCHDIDQMGIYDDFVGTAQTAICLFTFECIGALSFSYLAVSGISILTQRGKRTFNKVSQKTKRGRQSIGSPAKK